jgi:tetratricopeptide (TPR) repeat protein
MLLRTPRCAGRGPGRRVWLVWGGLAGLLITAATSRAQSDLNPRTYPGRAYYLAVGQIAEGEYRDALRSFNAELRGALKTTDSRWIDSICHHTMMGECFLRLGRFQDALDQYNAALSLYLAYSDWMVRVQFPPTIAPSPGLARAVAPWGTSTRPVQPGQFPNTMLVGQGRVNQTDVVQRGGVVQQAILFRINAVEIVRSTALALSRRRELLGPLAKHDRLTGELVAAISRRPGPPNHWSEAWIDLLLGLAYAGADNAAVAQQHLVRSLVVAGRYDHPLAGVALLELGRMALEANDHDAAAGFFEEATYSAYRYEDLLSLVEAFRLGQQSHLMAGRQGVYPPLAAAQAWAESKRLRELDVELLLDTAENLAVLGQAQQAQGLLTQARGVMGRRDLSQGVMASRWAYLSALVARELGNSKAAGESLRAALASGMSTRLFQIGLTHSRYRNGAITPRVAVDLYQELLGDPTPQQWRRNPQETLTVMTFPHRPVYEGWFEALLERKDVHAAIDVADLARRHAFHSTLPLGGRLLALRWILEAPLSMLPPNAVLQRNDLLARNPQFAAMSAQARRLRDRLEVTPPPLDGEPADEQSLAAMSQWESISHSQEQWIQAWALRREPSDLVFPPLRPAKEVAEQLPGGHVLLVYLAVGERLHGFMLNNRDYRAWTIDSPATLHRSISQWLREMGNYEQNRELDLATIQSVAWKVAARQVRDLLFGGLKIDLAQGVEELTIVPDGWLWYVPFEALPLGDGDDAEPVISRVRVRYAPTVGLGFTPASSQNRSGRTAIVAGRWFPRETALSSEEVARRIAAATANAVSLRSPLPAPSPIVAPLVDRLVVLDEIEPRAPYDWAPIPLDRPPAAGALSEWFPLPWGAPRAVILPGFRTPAENSLKKKGALPPGSELFLASCGLMSCGAETVLVSRWRTAGQSSVDLVRELIQELPHLPAADAWQRSVQLAMARPLDPQLEPRVKRWETIDAPTAAHPFFWAGHLLAVRGRGAAETGEQDLEPDVQEPAAVKFQAAAETQ